MRALSPAAADSSIHYLSQFFFLIDALAHRPAHSNACSYAVRSEHIRAMVGTRHGHGVRNVTKTGTFAKPYTSMIVILVRALLIDRSIPWDGKVRNPQNDLC